MRALDIKTHKSHLINILMAIYKDSFLAGSLGFKGGTAAMLFYGLPRFSVDLDFDLIKKYDSGSSEINNLVSRVEKLLDGKFEIKDKCVKYRTIFWALSYGAGLAKIKVEISTRDAVLNTYNIFPLYGVNIRSIVVGDMIVYKLMALRERKVMANRDLFDIHYFLSSKWAGEVNNEIIEKLSGRKVKNFYNETLEFLSMVNNDRILEGLGEVLTEAQKDWAKARLLTELRGLIEKQRDLFS